MLTIELTMKPFLPTALVWGLSGPVGTISADAMPRLVTRPTQAGARLCPAQRFGVGNLPQLPDETPRKRGSAC
jgi:hypothetical protein